MKNLLKFYLKLIFILTILFNTACSSYETVYAVEDETECSTKSLDCDSEGDNCTDYYYFGCFNGQYNCKLKVKDTTYTVSGEIAVEKKYTTSQTIDFLSTAFDIKLFVSPDFYFIKSTKGNIKYKNIDYSIKTAVGYHSNDSIFLKIKAINNLNDTIFILFNSVKI